MKTNLKVLLSFVLVLGLLAACAPAALAVVLPTPTTQPVAVPDSNAAVLAADVLAASLADYSTIHTTTVVEDGVEKVIEAQLVPESEAPSTIPDFDGIILTKDGLYQALPAGLFIFDSNWPDVSTFPKVLLPTDVWIEISKEEGVVAGACSVVEQTTLYVFITCWPVNN